MSWCVLSLPPEMRPAWLGEREVMIPIEPGEEACVVAGTGGAAPSLGATYGFDLEGTIARLADERWAEPMQSATTALPFPYDRLPWPVRTLGAVAAFAPGRLVRNRSLPAWPVAPSLDVLKALRGDTPPDWGAARWGFSLTCDVDSLAGWRRAPAVAEDFEAAGFRAAFYVVAEVLERAPEIAVDLVARGHEIGSHDVRHDNRLLSLDDAALDRRLADARESVAPFGGVGFRSPSLLRSPRLLRAIMRHFEYDSSVCDVDLEHPRGVTTVCPYALAGGVELPVTLPMDSSLRFTLHRSSTIGALWREKCGWVRAVGGLAILVTHAEPQLTGGRRFRRTVTDFLSWVAAQPDVEVLLPRDAAARQR